jgi:hypothetical protein
MTLVLPSHSGLAYPSRHRPSLPSVSETAIPARPTWRQCSSGRGLSRGPAAPCPGSARPGPPARRTCPEHKHGSVSRIVPEPYPDTGMHGGATWRRCPGGGAGRAGPCSCGRGLLPGQGPPSAPSGRWPARSARPHASFPADTSAARTSTAARLRRAGPSAGARAH